MTDKQAIYNYVQCNSIFEAGQMTGLDVKLLAALRSDSISEIGVIDNALVQIQYKDGILYRTAKGNEDISGDYTNYKDVKEFDINQFHAVANGCCNHFFLSTWTDGECSYSMKIPHGATLDNLKELLGSICPVDGLESDGVAMPNPMKEYSYVFEAEYAVGFGIMIPVALGMNNIEHIFVISGKVAELIYKNDIVYRTAQGTMDISGDFNTYKTTDSFSVGNYQVTAKGDVDLYYVALWYGLGKSWSISCPHGMHKASLIKLIESMNAVNACQTNTDSCSNALKVGGYGEFREVNHADLMVFRHANKLLGVDYQPLLVSTQLVNGVNYRFVCNAFPVIQNSVSYLALVTIFQPLSGEKEQDPVVRDIKKLC